MVITTALGIQLEGGVKLSVKCICFPACILVHGPVPFWSTMVHGSIPLWFMVLFHTGRSCSMAPFHSAPSQYMVLTHKQVS